MTPVPCRQVLEGLQRVRDTDQAPVGRPVGAVGHHGRTGAGLERTLRVGIAVEVLALQRKEQLSGLHRPAVGVHAG